MTSNVATLHHQAKTFSRLFWEGVNKIVSLPAENFLHQEPFWLLSKGCCFVHPKERREFILHGIGNQQNCAACTRMIWLPHSI